MRAFIAIDLTPDARQSLRTLQKTLGSAFGQASLAHTVRWTPVENIHLTLRFLGETTEAQHERLAHGLQTIALAMQPFTLCLRGLGCFPNLRRPSVAWTGVQGDLDLLKTLQAPIEAAARGEAFEPETRPFSPHLTLGRFRREAASADLARAGVLVGDLARGPEALAWRASLPVDAVAFFQSDLRPGGAVYTMLNRFRLGSEP